MSMLTSNTMPHEHLVRYLRKADIGKQAQIKVLRLIWESEKGGWNPPGIIKRRLNQLTKPRSKSLRRNRKLLKDLERLKTPE